MKASILTKVMLILALGLMSCKSGSTESTATSTPVKGFDGAAEPMRDSSRGSSSSGRLEQIKADMPYVSEPRDWGDDVPALGSKVELSEKEWKQRLTDEEFRILREAGTERAFSGALLKVEQPGVYHCAGCNAPLFDQTSKYDSRTGWPSFFEPIQLGRIAERADNSFGMTRTEVVCAACDGHLGHLFRDGPKPTGLRYCINSLALDFHPDDPDATVKEDEE